MKNVIATIILITLLSCRNSPTKEVMTTTTGTIKTKTNGVPVVKPDSITMKKQEKKDTIRNYKDTQMSEDFFQKAIIDLSDSSFTVYQNIRADYRIFGYQKPDTNSRKMILFSVFTSDVEGNPYQCPLGSYYYSSSMRDTQIKYVKKTGAFVEAHLVKDNDILPYAIYFPKNWVIFEERN